MKLISIMRNVDLRQCSRGDLLISRDYKIYKYSHGLSDIDFYDHVIVDNNEKTCTRFNKGSVFKDKAKAAGDIIFIIPKSKL